MKVKISKKQWIEAGIKTGWLKTSKHYMSDFDAEPDAEATSEVAEAWQSHEEDIIINEKGQAFYAGKLICHPNKDSGPDFKSIRDWMHESKYFPNVWIVNDHGNVDLYSIDDNGEATCHGGLV